MNDVFQTLLGLEISKLQFECAKLGDQYELEKISIKELQKKRYSLLMKIDFGNHIKNLIADYLEEN